VADPSAAYRLTAEQRQAWAESVEEHADDPALRSSFGRLWNVLGVSLARPHP
jgi:hypothetical protein